MNLRIVLTCLLAISPLSKSYSALTLKESYDSALRTNFGEKINQSLIDQSFEVKKENKANYYPKISAKGSYLKQENINDNQKTIGLNLTHSLYKGGRDGFSVESADKNIAIYENQKIAERLNLYNNVIQAYYNYFLNLNDLKNLELLKKQSMERVDETKKRVHVGRSRKGELLQAEAQLAGAEAQALNGEGLLKESEKHFYILTGLNKTENEFNDVISIPLENQNLKAYLDAAYSRVDVQSKELKVEQANLDLSISKSLHLPTLDLATNYYLNKRTGTYHNTNWDVGLTLSFPLFEGGATVAKISESSLKKNQAIYVLEDFKKSIQLEVTSRYEIYHRYLDQIKAFDLALEKAKNSYDESLNDYRLGLVSNLDLLSSLNLYLDSKRNSEKTKIQAMMNLKLLEAAAGVLP